MGPMSSRGRINGQGNLVEAKAMLKKAGKTMAASHRIVFHFSRFLFSEFVITHVSFGCGWLRPRKRYKKCLPTISGGANHNPW